MKLRCAVFRSIVFFLTSVAVGRVAAGNTNFNSRGERAALQITTEYKLASACSETEVEDVCTCTGMWTKVCTGCKDKTKWGVGCELDCPTTCPWGCDFLGNCLNQEKCKRQGRDKAITEMWPGVINEFGVCQACRSGAWGLLCEKECPTNCEDIEPEGNCTRAGNCYKCKLGWYGEDCSLQCPEACADCVMKDNMALLPGTTDTYLPAGACSEECENGDKWGKDCDRACPANCASRGGMPGCYRHNGECISCADGWWGETCENECNAARDGLYNPDARAHCFGNVCAQTDGKCTKGCQPGFWDAWCDIPCPERTVLTESEGCEQEDGKPIHCEDHFYPYWDDKEYSYICRDCPHQCKDGACDSTGSCTGGCTEGFFGQWCHKSCGPQCTGPCDKASTGLSQDGFCSTCYGGFTGQECTERCDEKCYSCAQESGSICTSCDEEAPEELTHLADGSGVSTSTCACIQGAERDEDGWCSCKKPADPTKEAFFEAYPEKLCLEQCRRGMQEVSDKKAGTSTCISAQLWKAVVALELKLGGVGKFVQGGCREDEYQIPVEGRDAACLRKEYVQDVLQD